MTTSPILQSFINYARHDIEPDNALREIFSYENAMLQKLIYAIDNQNDKELTATVFQMKAELDAVRCSVFSVLPALVNILCEELQSLACSA